MTESPLFLFDECLGKPSMLAIKEQVRAEVEFHYITDIAPLGTDDAAWLAMIAGKNYVVITADNGRTSSKAARLPHICKSLGITHVVLGNSIHKLRKIDKETKIIEGWPEILKAHQYAPGSKLKLFVRKVREIEKVVLELDQSKV